MLAILSRNWWVLLIHGLCAIALGLCAIFWPGRTFLAFIYLFGVFSLVDGVIAMILGFRGEPDGTVWWSMVLLGVMAVLAGIVAFAQPAIAGIAILAMIAALSILRGVFEIVAAVRLRKEIRGEWVLALSGLLSIIFGGLLLAWPGAAIIAIMLVAGAYMLALGALATWLSLRLRKLQHGAATQYA